MKANVERVSTGGAASFICRRRTDPRFGFYWHVHPEIELTLTDAGKPVTRRVILPAEYLDARAAPRLIASGIEAGGEEPLRVYVDARGVRASGYELCIFPNDCVKKSKR